MGGGVRKCSRPLKATLTGNITLQAPCIHGSTLLIIRSENEVTSANHGHNHNPHVNGIHIIVCLSPRCKIRTRAMFGCQPLQ